jgi:hypothetical protein
MKIYQVKYNNGHYAYYKAKSQSDVNNDTKTYLTYMDAKDEINPMKGYEHLKLLKALIEFYGNLSTD